MDKTQRLIASILSEPTKFNIGDMVEYTGKREANGMSKIGRVATCGDKKACVWFKLPNGKEQLCSVHHGVLKLVK